MRLHLYTVLLILLRQASLINGDTCNSPGVVQATARTEDFFRGGSQGRRWLRPHKMLDSIRTRWRTKRRGQSYTRGRREQGEQLTPNKSKSISLSGMVKATRPWTFTAGVVPVLHIAALIHKADGVIMERAGVLNALVMVVALQASVNLYNSFDDYMNGVDTVEDSGDRTIVDGYVNPSLALGLAGGLLLLGCLAVVPTIAGLRGIGAARNLGLTFGLGLLLSFSYTCWPLRLKYRGLGDIAVFLGFGPMLAQVAAVLITEKAQPWVLPHGIPAALLCEAILHANNMRDIEHDRSAGISTLAMIMGLRRSQLLYGALIFSAYAVASGLALLRYRGYALVLLSLPLALSAIRNCRPQTLRNLDETTAKVHLVFGVLMIAGVLLS